TVVGNRTVPPDVTGLTATAQKYGVHLEWDKPNAIDVSKYLIQQKRQDQWTQVDIADKLTAELPVLPTEGQPSKTYEFRVKALDSAGLLSKNWATTSITINAPELPMLSGGFDGPDLTLNWFAKDTDFPIEYYVLRRDGMEVDNLKTNSYARKAAWLGDLDWSIAAVDVAGNEGPEAGVT